MISLKQTHFIYLFACLLLSLLTGCQEEVSIEDAVSYDQRISVEITEVRQDLYHFFDLLRTNDEIQIKKQLEATHSQIKNSLEILKSMPTFDKSPVYRDMAIKLLSFYEKAVRKFYPEIIKLSITENPTIMEEERMEALLEIMEDAEEPLEEKLTYIRKKFAKDYNITYENTKEE